MLSAEMLSWMSGARRFNSIARSCDARTPVTVIVSNVTDCSPVLDLLLLALVDGVVTSWGPEPWAPALAEGSPVAGDAMADVAMAANSAMDTAIATGCLRCRLDTDFTS